MDLETEVDYVMGRASNIPECCIRFYTTLWRLPAFKEYYRPILHSVGIVSYIACPECIKERRFNSLKLDQGGYMTPFVLGWRYIHNTTKRIWVMTDMSYINCCIYWVGMTPEDDPNHTYRMAWGSVQEDFKLADKPLTFTIGGPT